MLPHQQQTSINDPTKHFCASQRLHDKLKKGKKHQSFDDALHLELSDKHTITDPVSDEHLSRNKRWLADEVSDFTRNKSFSIEIYVP